MARTQRSERRIRRQVSGRRLRRAEARRPRSRFAFLPRWRNVKGAPESGPTLYERWITYSRIRVIGAPETLSAPFGWGLSHRYPADRCAGQLLLSMDGVADTVLTRFDGNLATLEHLRYDITNLAHYLRRDASVRVVGAGGGRDVLAAFVFGQRESVERRRDKGLVDETFVLSPAALPHPPPFRPPPGQERWSIAADGVTHLQLTIKPDKGGKACRATLTTLALE